MAVPLGSTTWVAVFSVDPGISQDILELQKQLPDHAPAMMACQCQEQLLELHDAAVVIMALPPLTQGQPDFFNVQFDRFIQFLPLLHRRHPLAQVILVTPYRLSLEQSCQAVINDVVAIISLQDDFPVRLCSHIQTAHLRFEDLRRRQSAAHTAEESNFEGLVGSSDALRKVLVQARRAAIISDAPVVIYGESGTGKQRLAEIIHQLDEKRSLRPFVCVNCAAIAGTLAESELFGHRKGAFTGATDNRLGYFRTADGGTILLDEISELPLALQPKILRVLQEGLVLPVGSDIEHRVDVRVIAATNCDLHEMVRVGHFRLDLFQRLNVIQLSVPPLRQRTEDIPALFEAFLAKYAHYYRGVITSVAPEVYDVLARSLGSGNIRELENIVRQVLVFKDSGDRIELADLPRELLRAGLQTGTCQEVLDISEETIDALLQGSKRLGDAVDDYEKLVLARVIERGISQTSLADRLGVTRRTLYNKLQKYHLR